MQHLDPRTTALLLVDLQQGILGFPLAPHSGAAILEIGARLAKHFRAAGAPVVLTNVTWPANFADALQQPVDRPLPGPPHLPPAEAIPGPGIVPVNYSVPSGPTGNTSTLNITTSTAPAVSMGRPQEGTLQPVTANPNGQQAAVSVPLQPPPAIKKDP